MQAVEIFNAVEAVFWIGLAGLSAVFGRGTRGFTARRQGALVVFLAGFGISDIIEVFTGAWWKPVGLLVLKGACLSGLIVTAFLIYRARWAVRAADDAEGEKIS